MWRAGRWQTGRVGFSVWSTRARDRALWQPLIRFNYFDNVEVSTAIARNLCNRVFTRHIARSSDSDGTNFPLPEVIALVTISHPEMLPTMNIGETIRNYRLQKSMAQGDIEKRTGLLRCYLSRVENGHTIPSLDTLSKIAGAMELPLSQFFSEHFSNGNSKNLPPLTEDEVRFLTQIRRYSMSLNDSDRTLVLDMVKKMAAGAGK